MSVITRFAPSPTGFLHVGNVRTALICYLYAQKNQGKFMLRMDDTDTQRSTQEYAASIEEDLKWLGLEWDLTARQSDRLDRYQEVIDQLISVGRLYPCYETTEEIDIKRKMLLSRGKPPIYDRAALELTDEQKKAYEAEGRQKHWRFKLDETATIDWNDLVKGSVSFKAKNLSDPVLIRANGTPTYMLPSAIDDMDFNITHIVRGEDHVSNTAIQIQLFEAIGATVPEFAHLSLMKSKDGKISKRDGGFSIGDLRNDEHIESMTILSLLARLGTSEPIEARKNLNEIVEHFNLSSFTKASTTYDFNDLAKFNSKIIHQYDYNDVKDRDELKHIDEEFWNSVRPNISRLTDLQIWHHICKQPLTPIINDDDTEFTKQASDLLPDNEWNEHTWTQWTNALKQHSGRHGKRLFMPLRKALTALEHGPELKYILPLIGKEKTSARLNGITA